MRRNLDSLFRETVRKQPDHPAVLGPGEGDCLTYRQLAARVRAAGRRLYNAGLRPGDCVGLHVPSGIDYIILNYAVWSQSGCVVPVPVELTDHEKQDIPRQISLDFIISDRRTLSFAEPFQKGDPVSIGARVVASRVRSPRESPPGFADINAAFIRFTSGTTGDSKGVVLSHESIEQRIHAANEGLQIGPADRVLWVLSMSYHFAVSIVSYLTFGATIVLLPNHLGPALADGIRQHRCTVLYASPMHYSLIASLPKAISLPNMRLAISTAVSLPRDVADSFWAKCSLPVSQALGIIEVGLPAINLDFASTRPDAVGRVLPAYRLKINDAGLNSDFQELSFQGPGFLDAYYTPWRTREQIMPDGWFHTGDIGELDSDGCLYIRGRSHDVINVMGMKFFPREVEGVLQSHPGVQEACVFAQPDPRFGELPHARIVANRDAEHRPTERELLDFCRHKLADYKVPHSIQFVDQLERTNSGKLLRRKRMPPNAERDQGEYLTSDL